MQTLQARIERASEGSGSVTFIDGDTATRVEWARLYDDARAVAAQFQRRGVAPGVHVGILGPTSRELVTAIEATWLCGATAVVLPLPMRLASIEEFVSQTRARIRQADIGLLVTDAALLEFMAPQPDDPETLLLSDVEVPGRSGRPDAFNPPPDDPEALAILQYTSGSTSDPKGVMLPHRCVTANLDAISQGAVVDPEHDVVVSWLPLYHDMGLIGTLGIPLTTGTDLVLAPPQDFLAAPARWMEWMSAFSGTATAGPNFAYALATRALNRLDGLDLSRWRLALNGAEAIDPTTVDAFLDAGARHGLRRDVALCVFGMAEATLAVTFPELGKGMAVDSVDRRVLETDRYAAPTGADEPKARRLPLLGRALPGLEIRIVDPDTGTERAEREVGELEIRGASVTTGYYRNPEATERAFRNEWLRTGDLGYLSQGELVVCGRIKDIIIVGGRNVFPEDAEKAAAEVDGVRAGNVIAFGSEGRQGHETLVVVAESKAPNEDLATVRDAVARRIRDAVGLPAKEVVLVRPGSLPKTSSGKLQRALCRERYETSALEPL